MLFQLNTTISDGLLNFELFYTGIIEDEVGYFYEMYRSNNVIK